jgi:hypothetical protein
MMMDLEAPISESFIDEEGDSMDPQKVIDDFFCEIGVMDGSSNPLPSVTPGEDLPINSIPEGKTISSTEEEEISRHKYPKFAATYFQGNVAHTYSKKPLKNSLLLLATEVDRRAALAVWIAILRFMG